MNCQIPCAEYVNNRADHASLRVKPAEESKSNELLNNTYGVVEVIHGDENTNNCATFSICKFLKLFKTRN